MKKENWMKINLFKFNVKKIFFIFLITIIISLSFATNNFSNNNFECLQNFNLENNICSFYNLQYYTNLSCSQGVSYSNGTCIDNMAFFNYSFFNPNVEIEIDRCFNISCQEEGYHCVQGECILDISYTNVDSDIIYDLSFNEWTPVIVRLYDDSDLSYASNVESNREIYDLRAEYFNQVEEDVLSTLNDENFVFKYKFTGINGFAGYINLNSLETLIVNSAVEYIESDIIEGSYFIEESSEVINSEEVWNIIINNFNLTGRNQTVCVLDTGINASHLDLENSVVAEKCFCDDLIIGGTGCCPNGLFVDSNALDDNGHGTHVSGIIAANGSIKGIAFGSKIVAVKMLDENGSFGRKSDVVAAIDWCVDQADVYNISIISMSWGDSDAIYSSSCDSIYPSWRDEINNAIANGIFVDAAAGNEGNISAMRSPACIQNVTSVGSTYDNNNLDIHWDLANCTDNDTFVDQISCGSNRADFIDLFAPGSHIYSTYLPPSNYGYGTGTSQAAPHVAGVAALMFQANNSITPDEVRDIMVRTGVSIYDPNSSMHFPRIDAYRSVMGSMYDDFVSDTELVFEGRNRKVFSFNVFNDLEITSEVGFNFSLGNNVSKTNNSAIDLSSYDDLLVFVEYNYTTGGNYTANSTFNTNWQSVPIEIAKEISISNDTIQCLNCNNRRVFNYDLTSLYGDQTVDFQIDFGDGNITSSNNNLTILLNQTIFLIAEHNFPTTQEYTINATINSTYMREFTNDFEVNINQLG